MHSRQPYDSTDRARQTSRGGSMGESARSMEPSRTSRGSALAPRTAALANSRRHLGPLNAPQERRPQPAFGTRREPPHDGMSAPENRQRRSPQARQRGASSSMPGPRYPRAAKGSAQSRAPHAHRPLRGRQKDTGYYLQRSPIPAFARKNRLASRTLLMVVPVLLLLVVGGGMFFLSTRAKEPQPSPLGISASQQLDKQLTRVDLILASPRTPPTPKEQWGSDSIPFLYQKDPAWANEPYAGATIGTSGCGPTCLAMIYIGLTGKTDMTPVEIASFSESNGHVQDGMTAWTLFTDAVSQFGLSSEILPSWEPDVTAALEQGKPLVFNVKPGGDFTDVGHYIVASGLNDEGMLIVHDPNSYSRSATAWDVQHVIDQSSNIWAFSKA